MPETQTFSLKDIAEKLNTGISTANVLYNRFKDIIPTEKNGSTLLFPKEALDIFMHIFDCSHKGLNLEEIRTAVSAANSSPDESQEKIIPISPRNNEIPARTTDETGSIFITLLEGILSSQKRIAEAQEKRADAELKKAIAMEERARVEKEKAEALKGIALAIKHLEIGDTKAVLDKLKSPDFTEPAGGEPTMPDRDSPEEAEDLSSLLGETERPEETDDLSLLLDEADAPAEMEDLSLLLDETDAPAEVDDLSLLLDEADAPQEVDDLSLLLDEADAPAEVDDLSLLLDEAEKSESIHNPPLSTKKKPESLSLQPERELTKEEYKSKIIGMIIAMKEKEGLTAEETTTRLNKKGLKTFSGKPHWEPSTITGIYRYIESVKSGT